MRVRFEQTADVFDIPITVTLHYADGTQQDVIVTVTEATTEQASHSNGTVRGVEVNQDAARWREIEQVTVERGCNRGEVNRA